MQDARDVRRKLVAFGIGMAFAALVVPASLVASGRLSDRGAGVADPIGNVGPVEVGHDRDSVNVWFQAVTFNPETQKALFNVYPWPSSDLAPRAFASSTITEEPFTIFVDEMLGKGIYGFAAGDRVGAIKSEMDVLSAEGTGARPSDSAYPFDTYALDAWAEVTTAVDGGQPSPRRAFDFFYDNSVPGFAVTYSRIAGWEHAESTSDDPAAEIVAEREDGRISFIATFERTLAVRITVMLLCLLMLLNAASLIVTTFGVVRGTRPPSMSALIWSAASVLGTIQLRNVFPGAPRLGIVADYLSFFPTMIVSMVVALVITGSWIGRDDFRI